MGNDLASILGDISKIHNTSSLYFQITLIENWVFEPRKDILVHLLLEELFHPLNKYLRPAKSQIKIMGKSK